MYKRSFSFRGVSMDYEVTHNGKAVGTLRVEHEGLMTVFEARTRRLEGVQRLWVCGEDKCVYLGVLIPAGTELCLRKKLSRRDMMAFPEKIICASTAEPKYPPRTGHCTQEEKAPPSANIKQDKAPVPGASVGKSTERNSTSQKKAKGTVWEKSSMGTLTACCGGVIYTAIPATLRRKTPGVRLEIINGRQYIIFRRSC